MKILIADDREENLYLLETLLKGNGYEVVSAKNGVEALEKLKKEPVDLIISDILMPKMDGFRLCSKCKSDDKLRGIPFIFYTSTYRDKKTERFALSLGAHKFVVKPIEPEHFVKMIKDSFEEYKKGVTIPSKIPVEKEVVDYLKEYNEVLVKKLEKKVLDLEEAHKTLQTILDSAPFSVIVVGGDKKIRHVNNAALALAGYKSEKQIVGEICHKTICPVRVGECPVLDLGQEVDESERILVTNDRRHIPILKSVVTIRLEGEDVLLEAFVDITERKKAEEALRESEERYRDLFENANDLIQSVNKEGKFVYVNRKWLEVLGYTKEEVKKLTMWDILRKDQIPHCMEVFKKICSGEAVDQVETVFVSKNGKEIPVAGSADTQFKDGKFIATRGIFRDITEIKRTKEELEARVKELEEFHELTVGRELKMKQMEAEFERLRAKPGEKK